MSGKVGLRIGAIALCCLLAVDVSPTSGQGPSAVDGDWPRIYTTPSGGEITLFAPQVSSWDGEKHIVAFCAVSYMAKGASQSAFGAVKAEAETQVSVEERLVKLDKLQFTESHFPTLSREQVREVTAELVASLPDTSRVLALDRVLAAINKSQVLPKNVEGVKADPPPIYFSTRPAVAVVLDGDPIWSSIEGNDLKFAVNTNWDLFHHTTTNTLFLRVEESWLKATGLDGPWTPAGDLPASFKKLPDDDNWKEVKANVPGRKLSEKKAPTVYATTRPANLILLDGEPTYVPVAGTQLQWVSNTETDLFRLGTNGPVYCLLSGRWFSAPDYTGPWEFATPSLPEDFKNIPPEHERAHVRVSVPGTDEAAEAILLAQIPQTARVNRKEIKAPEVSYTGDPEFTPIKGTTCQQAVNTEKDILKVGDLYYMCFQGVWFMSRTPNGPWEATGEVPNDIYAIPAESECHHVTYVVVEHYDPADAYIWYAYTAGYTGVYIAWGVPVYGTGWYYPPYVYYGYPYPVYYPRWTTYGCGWRYNPWTGRYVSFAAGYGPYGGARFAASYNPHTGTYARGAVAYGPYGARGAAQAWNPRTGTYAATRQGSDAYGSWGSTYVQRGDDWVRTSRYTNAQTGRTTRITQTDQGTVISGRGQGGSGFIASGGENIYAGHDGNVYKRDEGGNWQKYENGDWSDVSRTGRSGEAGQSDAARQRAGEAAGGETRAGQTTGQRKEAPADRAPEARPTTRETGQAGKGDAGPKAGVGAGKDEGSPVIGQLDRDRAARDRGEKRVGEFNRQRAGGGGAPSAPRGSGRSGGGRRR